MRCQIFNWSRYAILGVVVSSMATTGCSTGGWKMPSTKMFSWSKKPSESTLAGSGPSSLTMPSSPAAKQTPSTIASAAAGNTGSNSPAGQTRYVPANQSASYVPPTQGQPAGTPPNFSSTSTGPNGAAAANGFVTGPYSTNAQNGGASSLANNGIPAKTAPHFSNAGYQSPTPPNGAANNPALANFAPPKSAAGPNGYSIPPSSNGFAPPPSSAPSFGGPSAPAGFAQTNPYAPQSAPTATPGQGGQVQANGYGNPAVANTGVNPYGAPSTNAYTPVGFNPQPGTGTTATTASWPGASSTNPPAQPAGFSTPSQSTYGSTTFRPGSTNRATNYNFAPPANSGAPSGSASGYSVPTTATGTSNPGFVPPPSSTYNR